MHNACQPKKARTFNWVSCYDLSMIRPLLMKLRYHHFHVPKENVPSSSCNETVAKSEGVAEIFAALMKGRARNTKAVIYGPWATCLNVLEWIWDNNRVMNEDACTLHSVIASECVLVNKSWKIGKCKWCSNSLIQLNASLCKHVVQQIEWFEQKKVALSAKQQT